MNDGRAIMSCSRRCIGRTDGRFCDSFFEIGQERAGRQAGIMHGRVRRASERASGLMMRVPSSSHRASLSLSLSFSPFILSAVALKLFAFGRARKTFDRRRRAAAPPGKERASEGECKWTRQKKERADISEAEPRLFEKGPNEWRAESHLKVVSL